LASRYGEAKVDMNDAHKEMDWDIQRALKVVLQGLVCGFTQMGFLEP